MTGRHPHSRNNAPPLSRCWLVPGRPGSLLLKGRSLATQVLPGRGRVGLPREGVGGRGPLMPWAPLRAVWRYAYCPVSATCTGNSFLCLPLRALERSPSAEMCYHMTWRSASVTDNDDFAVRSMTYGQHDRDSEHLPRSVSETAATAKLILSWCHETTYAAGASRGSCCPQARPCVRLT